MVQGACGLGLYALARMSWPVCLGPYVLARMPWPVCLGLYALACVSWGCCFGFTVLAFLFEYGICRGLTPGVRRGGEAERNPRRLHALVRHHTMTRLMRFQKVPDLLCMRADGDG